jgi:Tfp pilus assembly protein PilX
MKNTINQEGAASLLFTLVMIIIISLLAIGFSVITTNDQKATLDKSVSLQAEYAAQSGINSVVSGIINHNSAVSQSSTATCTPTGGVIPTFPNTNNTRITCLKWSYSPQSLVYTSTNSSSTIINPLDSNGNPTSISEVDIKWGPATATSLPLYLSTFSTASLSDVKPDKFPILKIVTANSSDMSNLTTTYVVPVSGTSSPVALGALGINIITVGCGTSSAATSCTAKLKCLQWTANVANSSCKATNGGLLTTSSFDGSQLSINISGIQGTSGAAVQFSNSQVQIDSTAQNGNTVKRLVAGYTIGGASAWSPTLTAATGSTALCKNFEFDNTNNNTGSPSLGSVLACY